MKFAPMLIAGTLAAGWVTSAISAPLAVRTFPEGRYVTGGVGEEEQAQLRALGSKFNLRVVTAQKPDGDYIAGAGVTIARGGQPLLQTSMPGPILYADLPPGAYRVRVTVEGQPQEQTVQLSAGETRNLVLHWRLPGS